MIAYLFQLKSFPSHGWMDDCFKRGDFRQNYLFLDHEAIGLQSCMSHHDPSVFRILAFTWGATSPGGSYRPHMNRI